MLKKKLKNKLIYEKDAFLMNVWCDQRVAVLIYKEGAERGKDEKLKN